MASSIVGAKELNSPKNQTGVAALGCPEIRALQASRKSLWGRRSKPTGRRGRREKINFTTAGKPQRRPAARPVPSFTFPPVDTGSEAACQVSAAPHSPALGLCPTIIFSTVNSTGFPSQSPICIGVPSG